MSTHRIGINGLEQNTTDAMIRVRLAEGVVVGSMTALELLDLYWQASHTEPDDVETLQTLAAEIIQGDNEE